MVRRKLGKLMYDRHYDRNYVIAITVVFVVLIGGMALIWTNSRGDISTEQYRSNGRCVEFTYRSNGWDNDLIKIEDC